MAWGILFELRFVHDHWLNLGAAHHATLAPDVQGRLSAAHEEASYLELRPTAETQAVLAGHKMIFKSGPAGALVGIELEPGDTFPRVPLGPDTVLRFALIRRDMGFDNYTSGPAPGLHLVSNDTGIARAGQLFLNRPVPAHDPARAYLAGELRSVDLGGGVIDLFQALRDTGPSAVPIAADWHRIPADTHDPVATYAAGDIVLSGNRLFQALVGTPGADLTDAADWAEIAVMANQYLTHSDAIDLRPSVFSVDVAALGATALELAISRAGVDVWRTRFEQPDPLTALQADLRGLPPGPARMEVRTEAGAPVISLSRDIYLSDQAVAQNWFGVVEIAAGTGAFALLDGAGRIASPVYTLAFAAQSARLRYHFAADQPVGPGADVAQLPGDAATLVTATHRPITYAGTGPRLQADDTLTGGVNEEIRLPQPRARGLSKEAGEWVSDLHLSNFPTLS